MASREKRALAPSKSKQKANNDSSSLSDNPISQRTKKTSSSLPNSRSQLARDIFEAVATGSQLPAKLEASLPRKRAALQTALKRKQKAKKTLIKVKQKVPIKSLKRIADAKKILNKKKKTVIKKEPQSNESSFNDSTESEDTKNKSKSAKKPKAKEIDADEKPSPKLIGKKTTEISPRGNAKNTAKLTLAQKRQDSKERESAKTAKQRSLSKEPEHVELLTAKQIKQEPTDNTYDLTIEEVIASSMLVEDGLEILATDESAGPEGKRKAVVKRSLRNGKLRQSVPKTDTDSEPQQRRASTMSSDASVAESTAIVKVEEEMPPQPEVQEIANHVDGEQTEGNNSGEEIGPTLRSKTKARDSKSEDEAITKSTTTTPKVIETKQQPRSRRSSLNVSTDSNSPGGSNMRRCPVPLPPPERMVDGSSNIDEMIDKIKLSIAKTIESKIYKTEVVGGLMVGSIEVPKLEEIYSPVIADVTKIEPAVEPKEEKGKEINTGVGPNSAKKEMKKEDVENTAPKVAKTAKEIERLVMGDEEPADSQSAKEKSEKPADDATAATTESTEDKDSKPAVSMKDEAQDDGSSQQSTESPSDSVKDSNVKQVEEVKKPVGPTRKSARVSAGKSSATFEVRKSLSTADISKELEKLDEEEKASESVKTPDVTVERKEDEPKAAEEVANKASTSEVDESTNETKTVTEASADTVKTIESSTDEKAVENEKMEADEPAEADKNEETLESLSRDVERLVEEDNENNDKTEKSMDVAENDVSSDDVEMRLMIDEDEPEIPSSESESKCSEDKTNNNDGCDQKSSTESTDIVQKDDTAAAASASDVQENPESETTTPTTTSTTANVTSKSAEIDEQSKVAPKAKLTEAEEVEEQKETRRVLRARGDKQKKADTAKSISAATTPVAQEKPETKVVKPEDAATTEVPSITTTQDNTESVKDNQSQSPSTETSDAKESVAPVIKVEVEEQPEPQIRTRRSREAKRPPPSQTPKNKRGTKKQEAKKNDSQQQNKEETMLDNEVATINENNRSSSAYLKTDENRGVSADAGNTEQQKSDVSAAKSRSKSENDVRSAKLMSEELKPKSCSPQANAEGDTESEGKEPPKDSDEASSSGESSSSVEKLMETPEDRAKKEDILRQLGLESWERVKERRAKKEQEYTGTLKTVIKIGHKSGDKNKRSRSPLKMILKQQGRAEGEESIDYYTIQKEMGTSGLGDSSSGANRKLSTNHKHSCGKNGCGPYFKTKTYPNHHASRNEDNDESLAKDRQSLVIPEKSSSFDIHPGRLCADNCCYCHGKFGSLDTPMHLAQMKSAERKMKILQNEQHLTKDSCLCDACYRHVDRKINASPTTMQLKPQRQPRQQATSKCMDRNCTEMARHHVKRRWLNKIKANIKNEVEIGWESTQQNLLTFCSFHYSKIEKYLLCNLCCRRLTRSCTYPVGLTVPAAQDLSRRLQDDGIPANLIHNGFVCKLCKYFLKLYGKSGGPDGSTVTNKNYYKDYRRKLLNLYDVPVSDSEEEEEQEEEQNSINQSSKGKDKEKEREKGQEKEKEKEKDKDKNRISIGGNRKSKGNTSITKGAVSRKSPDATETDSPSTSAKSSPEPPKDAPAPNPKDGAVPSTSSCDTRALRIEGTIEKLKKRKALDTSVAGPSSRSDSVENGRNVVEILAMDKEVTLTRLPKRPRLSNNNTPSNDITPVVQRLGANPSISVRTLFPGEEEMNLHANVEFNNVREVTPQGWEKCATMIQYDRDTKLLWQELQRPYGNQSSFLRHLILLEKYYRAGDLILAPNASRNAINYSTSVQNRLISYEGPEKPSEDSMSETIEYNNSRRLSGGYILEQRPPAVPSTSTSTSSSSLTSQLSKLEASSRVMKLTPGVSIIKKPPPNLQRIPLSGSGVNGSAKRKESTPMQKSSTASVSTPGGKVFQLSEPEFKRLQNLKRQKQMMNERTSSPSGSGSSNSPPGNYRSASSAAAAAAAAAQYQKAQQLQFQKHLRMQQEMLNQRSRGDFEPLVCDIRLSNENSPTQNLINLNNLNLPKSIQVTTKSTASASNSSPIPILPKIPKSLTVIPQTVARNQNK